MSGVKDKVAEFEHELHIDLNWPEAATIIGVAFAIAGMVVGIVLVLTVLGK